MYCTFIRAVDKEGSNDHVLFISHCDEEISFHIQKHIFLFIKFVHTKNKTFSDIEFNMSIYKPWNQNRTFSFSFIYMYVYTRISYI